MTTIQGFLVVLKIPESVNLVRNKQYRGVYRMPYYRLENQNPIAPEMKAMDRYVFGGVRDDASGLILSYDAALELLGEFSQSPREFEIIHCRTVPDSGTDEGRNVVPIRHAKQLGFDVAGLGGDFWSIVSDFPQEEEAQRFYAGLNENGLFLTAKDARDYLTEYRRLQLPDYDTPFEVLEVSLIEPHESSQTARK